MPTFTQAEVNDLLNLNFSGDYFSGLGKLRDAITNLAWYDFCQCQSGGAVTLPTPPVQPVPPVTIPSDIPNTTFLCQDFPPVTINFHVGTFNGVSRRNIGLSTAVTNPVGVHLTLTVAPHVGGSGTTSTWLIEKWGGSPSTYRDVEAFTMAATATRSFDLQIDPTYPHYVITGSMDVVADPGMDFTFDDSVTCQGQAAIGPSSCCPPDPNTVAQLQAILATVTLLQRQTAPFARVVKATHAGLSGASHLAVQGLIGARVVCTNVPASLGRVAGDPGRIFELGWLTWSDADGARHSESITSAAFLSYPPLAGLSTLLSYTLHPGVVATIQELAREP